MESLRLEEFNHWWIKGHVDTDLALEFKRDIYKEAELQLENRFVIGFIGLRRTGKTTLMYQLIKKLIDEYIPPERILFFSFDDNTSNLEDVIKTYLEIQMKDLRDERIFIFLDEIQKCSNWQNMLKKYYDLYPKIKFIISGSESLFLRKKTKETLAGRIIELHFTPFTFIEYLNVLGITENNMKYETIIGPLFMKFIKKGGFPETFSIEDKRYFNEYIRALVVDKILYKDIPKLFKIDDPSILSVLLELISTTPGIYIDYLSLSKQFGKDRRVIKDYISYLENSFLIRLMSNYRKGSASKLRKRKRAYPIDNALIYLYKNEIDEIMFSRMVETFVINKLNAISFWKNGNEIDAISNDVPIEVKYQENITTFDIKPIREFMKKFKIKKGIIITKKDQRIIETEDGIITLVPAWKWAIEQT